MHFWRIDWWVTDIYHSATQSSQLHYPNALFWQRFDSNSVLVCIVDGIFSIYCGILHWSIEINENGIHVEREFILSNMIPVTFPVFYLLYYQILSAYNKLMNICNLRFKILKDQIRMSFLTGINRFKPDEHMVNFTICTLLA